MSNTTKLRVPPPPVEYADQDYIAQLFTCLEGLMDFVGTYGVEEIVEDEWLSEQVTILWQTVDLVTSLYHEHTQALGAIDSALGVQRLTEGVAPTVGETQGTGLVLPPGVNIDSIEGAQDAEV